MSDLIVGILTGDCGATHAPANARTSTSGTTVGHTVTYRCNPGYRIMGTSTRTCQSNGQWSGSQPSCARELHIHATTGVTICMLSRRQCANMIMITFMTCSNINDGRMFQPPGTMSAPIQKVD